jgi:tetratricopeptide (TPR) repeat protein
VRLGQLYIAMKRYKDAEKAQLEALRIREQMKDRIGEVLTWKELTAVYVAEKNYKKASDYAQRAMDAVGNDAKVNDMEQIEIRQALGYALCGAGQCARALPVMQDALDRSKAAYGADSLPVGIAEYMLGYVYWHGGDPENGGRWMSVGTARMKVDLGWGHAVYLNAMRHYASFLRERGQLEAAAVAERELRMADAAVDARSLTGRTEGIRPAGLR